MQDGSLGYVIDVYNKYRHNDDVISIFFINGRYFCIRGVSDFKWGQPVLEEIIEDIETKPKYHVYSTLEEAENYIRALKRIEGSRL